MSELEFDFLGPYKVESVIGRGGMGTVYKGSHARSGEKVALKVIATGVATQSRFRRRFSVEIETLKMLKHPHIVQLIGYGEERGLLFYSMEYVEGHSLLDHLRQHRKLPWEDALQVGIETASALKHAHDMGIIHRDLKPANLLLNVQGQIKLTDFGIAKLFGSTDMTAAGSVIGTADYMAPEQAEGKTATTRSDLYSLGCVLYALMAGKPPFGGKSLPEVLYAVRYHPIPDLLQLVPNCPVEFAALIQELLEKDPQNRPPTALVVANRLKAIQQGLIKKGPSTQTTEAPSKPSPKIGKELTSLDLSDTTDNELRLTNPEVASMREQPTMLAPANNSFVTNEDHTSDATELPPGSISIPPQPAPISPKPSPLPPQEIPKTWEHSSESDSESGFASSLGGSRYTLVSEADESRYSRHGELVDPHRRDWLHYASIAGLVGLLVLSLVLGYRMLQPPSADDVFNTINDAAMSGLEGPMIENLPAMRDFLERFPDDPRSPQVKEYKHEAELAVQVRSLQRKAARGGAHLDAIELAFLDCMLSRDRDIEQFRERLTAFLGVYAKIVDLPEKHRQLVELASFALHAPTSLASKPPASTEQLEKLIRSAEGQLQGEELKKFYRDLLSLYEGKPWAEEQLVRIRKRIDSDAADGQP